MEAKGIDKLQSMKVSKPTYGKGTYIATYLGEDNEVGYREIQGDLGEPFDPNYLNETEQLQEDYLRAGEIGYCKKLNTLTKYMRKYGLRGEWDAKGDMFVLVRKIERNARTRTGRMSKKMEILIKQDAFLWIDDDTHEYVVDIAVGVDGSKEFYRGTHVREAVETAISWKSFNL